MSKAQWEEPAAFKRALARGTGQAPDLKKSFLTGAGLAGVMLVAVFYHGRHVGGWWGWSVLISLAFIPGVGLLPLIGWMGSNKIVASPKGITRSETIGAVLRMTTWRWEQIDSGVYTSIDLGGRTFSVLILRLIDGAAVPIAVTPQTNKTILRDLFQLAAKPLETQPDGVEVRDVVLP